MKDASLLGKERFLEYFQEIRPSLTKNYTQSYTAWICLATKLLNLLIVKQLSMRIVAKIASSKTYKSQNKMQSIQSC